MFLDITEVIPDLCGLSRLLRDHKKIRLRVWLTLIEQTQRKKAI